MPHVSPLWGRGASVTGDFIWILNNLPLRIVISSENFSPNLITLVLGPL